MKCAVCDSSDSLPQFRVGRHLLARCKHCGLVYTADFVPDMISYTGDEYFVRRNEYVARWSEFCSMFETLINKISRFKKNGNFLDVGAGVGALLHVASNRGFTTFGVEVSEWASRYANVERGLNVINATLEQAVFPQSYFDVVVINHVIEHVDAPAKLLAEAHRILKPDGLLVVGVPNIGSIMARLQQSKWPSLRPDEHIWHFSPRTLRLLLNRARFHEVRFEARENYPVPGWGPLGLARRLVNLLSVITDNSEAMLFFGTKSGGPSK